MFGAKLVLWILLGIGAAGYLAYRSQGSDMVEDRAAVAARQLDNDTDASLHEAVRKDNLGYTFLPAIAVGAWLGLGLLLFGGEISRAVRHVGNC